MPTSQARFEHSHRSRFLPATSPASSRQACDARARRGRTKQNDEIVTHDGWRAIGQVIGCAIGGCMRRKGSKSIRIWGETTCSRLPVIENDFIRQKRLLWNDRWQHLA